MRRPAVIAAGGLAVVMLFMAGFGAAGSPGAATCGQDAWVPTPAGRWTADEIAQLWVAEHGSTGDTEVSGMGRIANPVIAGAVGIAESGGDPNVVNSIGAGGLMQIHPPEPNYLDPQTNMRIAVRKFNASGWRPWEAFTGPDGRGDDGPWRAFLAGGGTVPGDGGGATVPCGDGDLGGATVLLLGDPWLAALPGMPGERCDARIIPDVEALIRRYRVRVTDCYAATGHEPSGEHPLGLATDIVPGQGGSWDDVDRLAHDVGWVRSCGAVGVKPACDLRPWLRFVGYDGYPNHGRGNHLHLSWEHGPGSPASTVTVFSR